MASSSNTNMNINNSSNTTVNSDQQQAKNNSSSNHAIKRNISEEIEPHSKKIMVGHHSLEQHNQNHTTERHQVQFISAAHITTNNNAMPEISDEELLAMALKFEKEHGIQ